MKQLVLGLAVAALAAWAPDTSAATDDWAADWSATANPNGPWAYLRGATLLPHQPTTCCGLPPSEAFAPSNVPGRFLPIFYRPGAPGTDVFVHSYDGFNGGGFLGEATLTWTAAHSGEIDVSGYFYYGQLPFQRSDLVTLRLGSTVLGSSTISFLEHATPATRWDFVFDDLAVTAGDVLSVTFQRTPGFSSGSVVGGNVVVVSTVPEPATAGLLALGLVLLAARRRSSSRSSMRSG